MYLPGINFSQLFTFNWSLPHLRPFSIDLEKTHPQRQGTTDHMFSFHYFFPFCGPPFLPVKKNKTSNFCTLPCQEPITCAGLVNLPWLEKQTLVIAMANMILFRYVSFQMFYLHLRPCSVKTLFPTRLSFFSLVPLISIWA